LTVIWEHGHAYQPRRIVNAVSSMSREVKDGVSIKLEGTVRTAANWFELMLGGGVYDLLIANAETRSLDIEPLTLLHLRRLNPKAFDMLNQYAKHGKTSIFPCPYSHPILPLLIERSQFDSQVNVYWAVQIVFTLLGRPKDGRVFLWLTECAYSREAARMVCEVVRRILPESKVFLLLDEFQGQDIDPCQPHKLSIPGAEVFVVFRSRWLSDAYAFCPDADWVINSIRSRVAQGCPPLLGAMIDAETYGGAYGYEKIGFFRKIREGVEGKVYSEGSCFPVRFEPVDRGAWVADDLPRTSVFDGTSWSDYTRDQLLHPGFPGATGIIAQDVGSLCRWTGLTGGHGKRPKETYFMVFEWTDPCSRGRYMRVLNSLWKVAFNILRDEVTCLVRDAVIDMLSEIGIPEPAENLLLDYWQVILDGDAWGRYIERMGINDDDEQGNIARLLLEAYRMANQESVMSDPTYWENFDTEVTWTSLSLIAGSLIYIAKASKAIGQRSWLTRCTNLYSSLLLDFDNHFRTLWKVYEHPMEQLYQILSERAKSRGLDLAEELARVPMTTDGAVAIARKAYQLAFGQTGVPVYKQDVNPFLILWKMAEKRDLGEEAPLFLERSVIFEWEKSIRSAVSEKSIPVRVGLLHAGYFPVEEVSSRHEACVDTGTEIIGGEAHAY